MTLYQTPSIALTLPSELVIEICRAYVENIKRQTHCCRPSVAYDSESFNDIINVSQVCRRWRDIITNCPEFWCHSINPHHPVPEWTRLLLERSKSRGITFENLDPGIIEKDGSPFFKELAYANRLLTYSVALGTGCQIWCHKIIPMVWSRLQFLCLTHLTYDEVVPDITAFRDENLLMPADFPSSVSTPKLEILHLHNCALANVSQITGLSNLKELHVSGNRVWTIPQWFDIISQLPHIRSLSLANAISGLDDLADDQAVWGEPNSNLVDLELEEFRLRDETFLCAKFFSYLNLMTSNIFQLECLQDEEMDDTEALASFIYQRIKPIVHTLITTNPFFSKCALRIANNAMECLGLPEKSSPRGFCWPEKQYSGAYLSDGAYVRVQIGFNDQNSHASTVRQLFRPVFNRIESLSFLDYGNLTNQDVVWISDLLWNSSHRLRQLTGVPVDAWPIINSNVSRLHDTHTPNPTTVPFLYALEELILWADSDEMANSLVSRLYDQRIAIGKPLKRIRHILPLPGWTEIFPDDPSPLEYLTSPLEDMPNEFLDAHDPASVWTDNSPIQYST
ncbi:hypothetical protein Agabi119p4_4083 [Agaricus bisporus var. burnettii]|uniref:F-box domain-containing protein n=1 Tax=Agaricus bisporus var. burnettii TaxID=192524 RepID=A0A8H7F2U1_AGABI|nr:hypothetical protein Agabi119p4_4083 [Agaricus bisporus var. burnettii]